jgi:hypothetical protein
MSRRGNCHDNAVAESFFQLLNRERIKRKIYPTRELARQDIFDYIEMALGALNAANELGLAVPEQLSVVGWDDLILAGLPQVNLTTMQVPKWQLGGTAAKLLIRRINMPDADIETGLVAVDCRSPRQPLVWHVLGHDKAHRKANRHSAVFTPISRSRNSVFSTLP